MQREIQIQDFKEAHVEAKKVARPQLDLNPCPVTLTPSTLSEHDLTGSSLLRSRVGTVLRQVTLKSQYVPDTDRLTALSLC